MGKQVLSQDKIVADRKGLSEIGAVLTLLQLALVLLIPDFSIAFDPNAVLGAEIGPGYEQIFAAPNSKRMDSGSVFDGSSQASMTDPINPLFGSTPQKTLLGTDNRDMNRNFVSSVDPLSRITTNTFSSGYLNDPLTTSMIYDTQNSEAATAAMNIAYHDPTNLNVTMSLIPNMMLEKVGMLVGRVSDITQRASSGVAPVLFAMIDQCIATEMAENHESFETGRRFCEGTAVVVNGFLTARGGLDGNCEDKSLILATGSTLVQGIIKGIIGNQRLCAEPIGDPNTPDYVLSFKNEMISPLVDLSEKRIALTAASTTAISDAFTAANCERSDSSCTETIKTALTELSKASPLLVPTASQLDTLMRGYQEESRETLAQYLGRRHANAAIGALCKIAGSAIKKGPALGLSQEEQRIFDSKYAIGCGAFEEYMADYNGASTETEQYGRLLNPGSVEDQANAASAVVTALRTRGQPSMTFGGEGFQRAQMSK